MSKETQELYRGYTLYVNKETTGFTEYFVTREEDQWFIIDDFSYDNDSCITWIDILKGRVDQFIDTKGLSEGLDEEY